MKKIVLAGPPRSGKSCLREGLKQALRALPGAPYPYVITACPDGEGSWFQETVNRDPQLASACKAAYKAKFTPEFVGRIANSVATCPLEFTLVDIGGFPSHQNHQICASATHLVILMPVSMPAEKFREVQETYRALGLAVPETLEEVKTSWRKFAEDLGLTVVAEVNSDYYGTQDTVDGVAEDGVLRGSVHHLERGEVIGSRPMVQELASHLVQL